MLSITIDQIPSQIKTRELTISGTSSHDADIEVSVGGYDTFYSSAVSGIWTCDIVFQDIHDGTTEIAVLGINAIEGNDQESIIIDYLAPSFEDSLLIITPNPRIVSEFSTLITITTKAQGITIRAGADPYVEKYNYTAEDTLSVPIVQTSNLWIYLSSGDNYTFNCVVSTTTEEIEKKFKIVAENGIQFPLSPEDILGITDNGYETTKTLKIDDNKFFRIY